MLIIDLRATTSEPRVLPNTSGYYGEPTLVYRLASLYQKAPIALNNMRVLLSQLYSFYLAAKS